MNKHNCFLKSNHDTILSLYIAPTTFATVGIKSRKLKISKWKIKVYLLPAYKNILHIKQPKSKKIKIKIRKKILY